MAQIERDPLLHDERGLTRAVTILRRGGLVAFPTETVYGLGARALDPAALAKVFEAKGRPATHPLIAHVLGTAGARALASEWPEVAERLARAFWPGPLTLVVPKASHVPGALTGGGDSVGVRAPSHPIAIALLRALAEPIAAPSANRFQTLSPTTADHVAASLGDRVELILDGGPCESGIESTVVDVRGDAPRILRLGALDYPTLAAVAPELIDAPEDAYIADEAAVRASPGMARRHYAPRTPLILAPSRDAAIAEAVARAAKGEKVALLLLEKVEGDLKGNVRVVALGGEALGYAKGMFAALHSLDAGGAGTIVAEPVPVGPAWRAIADRMRRAETK